VSDSSLAQDRGVKKRLYAAARIPVYWIVNLLERQIEVYTDPSGPADQPDYRNRQDFAVSDSVPFVIDGRELGRIAVVDLLP
jgi:Uma2 family endonuclease